MCNKAVEICPWLLEYIPDQYKTKGMCDTAMCINPASFYLVPDHFKTQDMCIEAVRIEPFHWCMSQIISKHKTCALKQLE